MHRQLSVRGLRSIAPLVALTLAGIFPGVSAAEPGVTFARDVAPIFFEHCVSCHRPGEVAPMSLLSYDGARPWAKSIRRAVAEREMPPWFADPQHGAWANDRRLSEREIETIVAWVEGGAPAGDLSEVPPPPRFTEGWQLGEPDYVIDLPPVEVPATGDDIFPNPIIRLDIPERRWIQAVEVRPGDREVNHHVVLFMSNGRAVDDEGRFNILAVWAAGTGPTRFPEAMGRWVSPGDVLVGNLHYHPNGVEARTDHSRVGLYFGEGEPEREVAAVLAGTMDFSIPAHAANHELRASYELKRDSTIVSYFPHMHLRGKDMAFFANYPDGRRETLLSVPRYDFDWQLFYYPEQPKLLPAGTEIEIVAHYDNSDGNENNPDPSRAVGFGLQSTDEMMFGVFEFIEEPGVTAPTSESASLDP